MLQRWCRLQWHELHWLQIVKQWLYQFLKRKKIGVFLWVRNVVQNFIWHPVARFARWEYLPWPAPVIRTTLFSNSAMTDFFFFVDFCKSGLTGVCQTPQHMIIRKDNASKNRSNYVQKVWKFQTISASKGWKSKKILKLKNIKITKAGMARRARKARKAWKA